MVHERAGSIRAVPTVRDQPERGPGRVRGDRALAIRVIGETGSRAARRPFAAELHPAARWPPLNLGLDRVPRDVVRRALRRLDRLVVRYAGGALLAMRRVDRADAVRLVHRLDHRCFELEQHVASLEAETADDGR